LTRIGGIFVTGRALVRRGLSRLIDVDPADWRFAANRFGRPEVSSPAEGRRLRFSASRTTGLVMVAVTTGCEVGAAVERLVAYPEEIVRQFFSANEIDAIRRAPDADRSMLFIRLWTLKEAYLKARGLGLSLPLSGLSFQASGETARLTIDPSLHDDSADWAFRLIQPGPQFVAALCIDARRRSPITVEMERLPVG
jgi:4'-phosphopantetheinyl transferase